MDHWDPPICPQESADPRFAPVPPDLAKPADLADAEAAEIGSIWRTTRLASAVNPGPTLALLAPGAPADRYTLAVGTRLRLIETYEPSRDPRAADLDAALFYGFFDGRGYRAYEILDGPAAGRRISLPAGGSSALTAARGTARRCPAR